MVEPRRLPVADRVPVSAPAQQRETLQGLPVQQEFHQALAEADLWPLRTTGLDVLQINVGKLCNQTCRHCHVDAGPHRTEAMDRATFEECLRVIEEGRIATVDITGGAPELNPHFRWFVQECRALGVHVMDRCNLTLIETKAHADLPAFFAANQVEVVCSLPQYRAYQTDRQRGDGVFEKSISALQKLNAVGYGDGKSGLRLALVTNPAGAFLPGDQEALTREWKREMAARYGVVFDVLYTITNMPISRYLEWLEESGNLEAYMQTLVGAFNPAAATGVMCRNMLSVSWDGRLYDCDFNQMLDIGLDLDVGHIRTLRGPALEAVRRRPVAVARHCYGCTAGAGSSCGGATA